MSKTKTLDEMTNPEPYYVIVMHKKGALPIFYGDRHLDGPAIFDSRAEAQQMVDRAQGRDGWHSVIVRLKDLPR